jgi:hypothetical protein
LSKLPGLAVGSPVDGAAIELEVPFADRFERLGESTNALGLMLNAPFSAAQSRPDVDLLRGMGGLKPLESFDILPKPCASGSSSASSALAARLGRLPSCTASWWSKSAGSVKSAFCTR